MRNIKLGMDSEFGNTARDALLRLELQNIESEITSNVASSIKVIPQTTEQGKTVYKIALYNSEPIDGSEEVGKEISSAVLDLGLEKIIVAVEVEEIEETGNYQLVFYSALGDTLVREYVCDLSKLGLLSNEGRQFKSEKPIEVPLGAINNQAINKNQFDADLATRLDPLVNTIEKKVMFTDREFLGSECVLAEDGSYQYSINITKDLLCDYATVECLLKCIDTTSDTFAEVCCDTFWEASTNNLIVSIQAKPEAEDRFLLRLLTNSRVAYPTTTSPSFTAALTSIIGATGASFKTTGTFLFNRGTITPAYGTSGFRSGPLKAINCSYGTVSKLDPETGAGIFEIKNLKPGRHTVQFTAEYEEGEKLRDSLHQPYGEPFPAGGITQEIEMIGLTAAFAFDATGNRYQAELLDSETGDVIRDDSSTSYMKSGYFSSEATDTEGYQFQIPESLDDSTITQAVFLPVEVELVGVKQWNSLMGSGVWSWQGTGESPEVSLDYWKKDDRIFEIPVLLSDGTIFKTNFNLYVLNTEVYGSFGDFSARFVIKPAK